MVEALRRILVRIPPPFEPAGGEQLEEEGAAGLRQFVDPVGLLTAIAPNKAPSAATVMGRVRTGGVPVWSLGLAVALVAALEGVYNDSFGGLEDYAKAFGVGAAIEAAAAFAAPLAKPRSAKGEEKAAQPAAAAAS